MYFFNKIGENNTFMPRSVEHAYLAILNDDLKTAEAVFESIDSPRANWGRSLVGILSGFMEYFPTYLDIRNFYEIDLDFLIKNEKIDYISYLLGAAETLTKLNREIYKYTARVMDENKFYDVALKYMEKSKDIFYNDAELHFMLAKYYFRVEDYDNSNKYIDECLKLIPSYHPAIVMKSKINQTYKS